MRINCHSWVFKFYRIQSVKLLTGWPKPSSMYDKGSLWSTHSKINTKSVNLNRHSFLHPWTFFYNLSEMVGKLSSMGPCSSTGQLPLPEQEYEHLSMFLSSLFLWASWQVHFTLPYKLTGSYRCNRKHLERRATNFLRSITQKVEFCSCPENDAFCSVASGVLMQQKNSLELLQIIALFALSMWDGLNVHVLLHY